METVSTGRAEMNNNETGHITPYYCLLIPHVLKTVLQHCSDKDLLQYSLVNKQWNYEARSVLRNRDCIKVLRAGHDCGKLAEYFSVLQRMNVIPFRGMIIAITEHTSCDHTVPNQPAPTVASDPLEDKVLGRLSCKSLALLLLNYSSQSENCPLFGLAKNLLRNYGGVLEWLWIGLPFKYGRFVREFLQDCKFPRLKNLNLPGLNCPLRQYEKWFIKELLSRSPNLEEVHLTEPDLRANVLEGTSAVLAVLNEIDPLNEGICEGLLGALRLHRMKLEYIDGSFSLERFNKIVPAVLQTSRTALKSLNLEMAFLVNFMCYGICLENVTQLTICINWSQTASFQPRLMRLLKAFDFTRTFPRLNSVTIEPSESRLSHNNLHQIIEQGRGACAWKQRRADRAVRIKTLTVRLLPIIPQFLASMFPSIEKLEVELASGRIYPKTAVIGSMWDRWVSLKECELHIKCNHFQILRRCQRKFDSLFCGIFPQEVAELRKQDQEYLKRVNIVPVMPSITCLKELRILRFVISGCACRC